MLNNDGLMVDEKYLETCYFGNGDLDAPTIVLLHEGLGCVDMWKGFPRSLQQATSRNVFLYSRTGYGRSDKADRPRPLTYMHDEGLTVLPAILDASGLTNVILFGHSDGGSIALINAGGVQDARVKGVLTLSAHVFNETICVENIREAKFAYDTGKLRNALMKYHGNKVDNAFRGWNDAWLDPEFMNWNLEKFLPSILVPVLVVQGGDDQYGTEKQVHAICDGIGENTSYHFIPECRHSPHFDQPEETLKLTQNFVNLVWH